MKISDLFENWGIKGLHLKAGFMEMEWQPQPEEEQAAWELYIELITRITTQPLSEYEGKEKAALASVYNIFPVTRQLLRAKGRKAQNFSKIAIVVLNQKIRPFTTTWHGNSFDSEESCHLFRQDLAEIQQLLTRYAGLLAAIAGVEDFLELDQEPITNF